MRIVSLQPGLPARTYTDVLGRLWDVEKLDALLGDESVKLNVMTGASIGLRADATWCPGSVWTWANVRYRRETTAALLHLLITRFFDTEGAQYLGRRPCR